MTRYERQRRGALRHIRTLRTIDERDMGISPAAALALGATLEAFGAKTTVDYPPCLCPEPSDWGLRRLDRPMEPSFETRTCLRCGATTSIAHCELEVERGKCRERAYWLVRSRTGRARHACEYHAIEAIQRMHCEVQNIDGDDVELVDGNLTKVTP